MERQTGRLTEPKGDGNPKPGRFREFWTRIYRNRLAFTAVVYLVKMNCGNFCFMPKRAKSVQHYPRAQGTNCAARLVPLLPVCPAVALNRSKSQQVAVINS